MPVDDRNNIIGAVADTTMLPGCTLIRNVEKQWEDRQSKAYEGIGRKCRLGT